MWIRKGPIFKNVTEHTFNSVFKARGYVSAEPAQPVEPEEVKEPVEQSPPEETTVEQPKEPEKTPAKPKRQVKKGGR